MADLLKDKEGAAALGEKGREHVRDNFLLPELVKRYLMLLRYYGHVDKKPPAFRLGPMTYMEYLQSTRPWPQDVPPR